MIYSVKEAKDRFSEVIKAAENGQPQIIRLRDKEVAIVISIEDWKRCSGQAQNLVEVLRSSPLVGCDLDFSRQQDYPRDVEFGD